MNEKKYNKYLDYMSFEGKKAIKEAIDFLNKAKPMEPFSLEPGMTAAAYYHGEYMKKLGKLSHDGPKGLKSMTDRMNKFGKYSGYAAENCDIGVPDEGKRCSGLYAVFRYVIDDGVPSRGHRENCFSPNTTKIGIGIVLDKANKRNFTVFDFAGSYTNDDSTLTKKVLEEVGYS